MIHLWRDLPVVLAAPAQTLFVLLFTIRPLGAGRWWTDFVGRALALKSIALMLLLDAATLGTIAQAVSGARAVWDADAHDAIDGAIVDLYWLVAAAIYYQLAALIYQRRHHGRR